MTTARDVPLIIVSPTSTSERRITPAWSITQLKDKLEHITGIPPSAQILNLRLPGQTTDIPITAPDESAVQIGAWDLVKYAELRITIPTDSHTLTTAARSIPNPNDSSQLANVEKQTMPIETYTARADTVLAYKKEHQLGRFDPNATSREHHLVSSTEAEVEQRNIKIDARCHLVESDTRRGIVRYIGPITELPGPTAALWVGIELDEPLGKNDGTVATSTSGERVRYFDCPAKRGVFVRPDRLVTGNFPVLDEFDDDDDSDENDEMAEI